MDQKKKQQVLLAIVAVVALGAGGVFYLSRDTGANTAGQQNTVRTGRKVRQQTAAAKTKKRTVRRGPRKKAVVTGRKERGERAGPRSSSRKTRGRKKAKVKKAKRTPAA